MNEPKSQLAAAMAAAIAPKSDQINADDLIGGDMDVKIQSVSVNLNSDQKVAISLVGEKRIYRPCKSMARVMVSAWGGDPETWAGKSLRLYRDPKARFGGAEVGGIRIRAMSHIETPLTMVLSESKAKRVPFRVSVLGDPLPRHQAEKRAETTASPTTPPMDRTAAVVAAFARFGVDAGTLAEILGKPLRDMVEADFEKLTDIRKDLKAGGDIAAWMPSGTMAEDEPQPMEDQEPAATPSPEPKRERAKPADDDMF